MGTRSSRSTSFAPSLRFLACSCLCLWLCSSSSPMAVSARKNITHLPGFDGPLPFALETGYVEVDEKNGVQLFYYFIQSEGKPEEDPLMLWLTGGPGCSALSGLVYEIGPLSFDLTWHTGDLPKLLYKPDSWTKVSNIIFLDSPVGTGFSYSSTKEGYKTSDTKTVKQILIFLRKWLDEHQEFVSNPLYIGGDSYCGLIVPTVTLELARGKESDEKPPLNLKGYFLGNPVTDPEKFDHPAKIPFAHGMGLISDELYELYKKSCVEGSVDSKSIQCSNCLQAIHEGVVGTVGFVLRCVAPRGDQGKSRALQRKIFRPMESIFFGEKIITKGFMAQCVKGIFDDHILEPVCPDAIPQLYELTEERRKMLADPSYHHLLQFDLPLRYDGYVPSIIWANKDAAREALGIHKGTVPSWNRCNKIHPIHDIVSTVEYHLTLTTTGYRALIYSGDHDMVVPFIGTQAWIRSLNFSIVDDWRQWRVGGQIAGYTRSYSNNLTFATVKGAGHTAPEYKPKECLAMVARWLSIDPL